MQGLFSNYPSYIAEKSVFIPLPVTELGHIFVRGHEQSARLQCSGVSQPFSVESPLYVQGY